MSNYTHTADARRRISEAMKRQYRDGSRKPIDPKSKVAKKISKTIKNKFKKGEYKVWHKWKTLPQWVRDKLSTAHIGQKGKDHPLWNGGGIKTKCSFCKKIFIGKSKNCSVPQVYCSKKCFHNYMHSNGTFSGKNNPKWKGGITPKLLLIRSSGEYRLWRRSVFKRDNYTCVFCGIHGGQLNADHILPFSKYIDKRFDINNGRTLCVKCHKRRHSIQKDRGE